MKTALLSLAGSLITLMLAPVALAGAEVWNDSGSKLRLLHSPSPPLTPLLTTHPHTPQPNLAPESTDTPSSDSDWQYGPPKIHHSGTDMEYTSDGGPDTIDYKANWGIRPQGTGDGIASWPGPHS